MEIKLLDINYDDFLVPWLGSTQKVLEDYFNETIEVNQLEITRKQWKLMSLLKATDGASQNDIAQFLNRDKATITRMLSALERKNLIARIPNKVDKRSNLIHLTKQGYKTLEMAEPIIKDSIEKIQSNLSIDEIHQTISVLKKLQHTIKHLPIVAVKTK